MNALRQALVDTHTAATLIQSGATLAIAGDESVLAGLPRGNWIGGTIPYFMAQDGGSTTRKHVFVTAMDADEGLKPRIAQYDPEHLPQVCTDAPDNGFSLIILPAFSQMHFDYAKNAPMYDDMYIKPIVGWISGMHLDDTGIRVPKVVDGRTGALLENRAVVLHVPLPDNISVNVNIVNLFSQGCGDVMQFEESGFEASSCIINGRPTPFAQYLKAIGHDTRLPLVADYNGASINVSFKSISDTDGKVEFYGPVFPHVEYLLARPFGGSYETAFAHASASLPEASFSCNCILNYLHSELEGKHTGNVIGPMTFGEVAYQLLNQTMVHMTLELH
ncbi:MAG: hypothetical protein Q8Q81_04715 [Oxalobacteraceae bacterium]|nr:hypothetical protein [Oxalobacteraceae bacterium]